MVFEIFDILSPFGNSVPIFSPPWNPSGATGRHETHAWSERADLTNKSYESILIKSHSQRAFKVAPLAAGGIQYRDASGGPAGGQAFEKFDKQVFVVCPI